jgi:hypothetical protein
VNQIGVGVGLEEAFGSIPGLLACIPPSKIRLISPLEENAELAIDLQGSSFAKTCEDELFGGVNRHCDSK